MATLLKYKKGLKRPTLAWNEMSFVTAMSAMLKITVNFYYAKCEVSVVFFPI